MINMVTVRWHDGYLEEFKATEVRFGSDLLWMRLEDGNNRHIPLRSVRRFGMSHESHQTGSTKSCITCRYNKGIDCSRPDEDSCLNWEYWEPQE